MSDAAPLPDDIDLSHRWIVLPAATLTQATSAFVLLGIGALTAFFQETYDLSAARSGLIITAVALVPLFALVPVGRLLDRRSERIIMVSGAMLLAAGATAAAFTDSYVMLLTVLLIGGAGYATTQPGGSKVVAGWFPPRQRGLGMGIRQTGLPLGGALAAATLPWVAATHGLRSALLTAAAVAVSGVLIFAVVYRRPPLAFRGEPCAFGPQLRALFAHPEIRTAMWASFALVSSQMAIITYLIIDLRDTHDIAVTRAAWALAAAQVAGMAGRVVLAAWSDRLPSGRITAITVALVGAAAGATIMALFPATAPFWSLLLLAFGFGFFSFGWYGPWVVHVAEVAPDHAVGLALALAMTANQLAIVTAPPLFGLLVDVTGGFTIPWLVVAAVLLLAAARVRAGTARLRCADG